MPLFGSILGLPDVLPGVTDMESNYNAINKFGFGIWVAAILTVVMISILFLLLKRIFRRDDEVSRATRACLKAVDRLEDVVRELHAELDGKLGAADIRHVEKLNEIDKAIAQLNSTYRAVFNLIKEGKIINGK